MQINNLYSKKQIEYVLSANKRWNFKSGATRSGKTYIDTDMIIPSRIRERVGKDGLNVILDALIQQVKDYTGWSGLLLYSDVTQNKLIILDSVTITPMTKDM